MLQLVNLMRTILFAWFNTSPRKAGKQQLEIIFKKIVKKRFKRKKFYHIIKILDFFLSSDLSDID